MSVEVAVVVSHAHTDVDTRLNTTKQPPKLNQKRAADKGEEIGYTSSQYCAIGRLASGTGRLEADYFGLVSWAGFATPIFGRTVRYRVAGGTVRPSLAPPRQGLDHNDRAANWARILTSSRVVSLLRHCIPTMSGCVTVDVTEFGIDSCLARKSEAVETEALEPVHHYWSPTLSFGGRVAREAYHSQVERFAS